MYGFIFGGISTVIYQVFFKLDQSKKKYKTHFESIFLFTAVTILAFLLFVDKFNFNSIVPLIVVPLFVGFYAIFYLET